MGVVVMLVATRHAERAIVHGGIMAIGVAVANAILLVTFAGRRASRARRRC
jgi:multidrug efflux pump subunit AcrB